MLITNIILFHLFILSVVPTQDFHLSTETKISGVTPLNDLVFHNVFKLKFDVKLVGDKMNIHRQKIIRSTTHLNLINLFDAKSSCFNSPLTQQGNVFRNLTFHRLFIDYFFCNSGTCHCRGFLYVHPSSQQNVGKILGIWFTLLWFLFACELSKFTLLCVNSFCLLLLLIEVIFLNASPLAIFAP